MIGNLKDRFGRDVTYLRLSLTDRCDLRCHYCMAETMSFLPKSELLSFEELERLCDAFIARGVRRIRLTGGEPLVRRGVMDFIGALSGRLAAGGLDEITLTTNGTQLEKYAKPLAKCGIKRINVSLDSLDPKTFQAITRRDVLPHVLAGIDAAQQAGIAIKINMVALKGQNIDEIPAVMEWAHAKGMDLTLIEVMPMGEIDGDRLGQFMPLPAVFDALSERYTLAPSAKKTGGPARYFHCAQTGGTLGLISPLTNNFCAGCNRVRVTCTGQIYMCLGQSDRVDLRAALRADPSGKALDDALTRAMIGKPERHDFEISAAKNSPAIARHMSVTGG